MKRNALAAHHCSVDLDSITADARVTVRRQGPPDSDGTCVVYWMQRAQRGIDNPALDLAVDVANLLQKPAVVFFAPIPYYPHANLRAYAFLAQGIRDIAEDLRARNIGFVFRRWPDHSLLKFCEEVRPALVVGDENPLRETERWRQVAAERLKVPLWTVDADVIVPSSLIEKAQYDARIIRPRLHHQLTAFLTEPANAVAHIPWQGTSPSLNPGLTLDTLTQDWPLDRSVSPVSSFRGGTRQGMRLLDEFITAKLPKYDRDRNHPELDGTSRLSPYLHFGQISPVRLALAVQAASSPDEEKLSFMNELLVWRELAINFVRTNRHYDSFECAENWSRKTLAAHARDERPVIYTPDQLENATTHDELWNAAQRQMVSDGWMHNYMRMYWAKKILEWTPSPQEAYAIAVHLNDKYFLDGRDPNGYAGAAWAITGKFDRPWFDRPIFGTVRYMSGSAAAKKFDAKTYMEQHRGISTQRSLF